MFKLKSEEFGYTKGILFFINLTLLAFIINCIMGIGTAPIGTDKLILLLIQHIYYVIILILIRSILVTTIKKDPFSNGNIQKLRIIGFMLCGMEVLIVLIIGLFSFTNIELIIEPVIEPGSFYKGGDFIAGGIILAISEVFRTGKKLKEESELTV